MSFLGRRKLFRTLGLGAGAYLLAPMRRQLVREARGQAPPKRLVIYGTGGGFPPEYWPKPGATDDAFTLGESLAPLEPWKSELLFLERFYNPFGANLHGNGMNHMLTMVPQMGTGESALPGGISLDRLLAKTISKDTPILSLNLSCHEVDDSDPQVTYSADGPAQKVPPALDPLKTFDAIFGSGGRPDAPAAASTQDLLAQDRSLLDAIRADVAKASGSLAGPERAKLDQYLTSMRDLEKQLGAVAEARVSCKAPARPPADVYAMGRRSPKSPVYEAMLNIACTALVCGMTRVLVFLTREGELTFLPGAPGFHQMWHGKGTPEMHRAYYRFHYGNMALLRQRLAAAGEGSGTMADQTLFMNVNDCGGPHHNGSNDYYVLLLGRLGGRLRAGRYVASPKMQRSMSDVFVTVANALGVPLQQFGDPKHNRGVLPGLLA
jgi:hypothetical protein